MERGQESHSVECLRLRTQTNYFHSQEFQHLQDSLAVFEEHYERQESLQVKKRVLILHPLHVTITAQIQYTNNGKNTKYYYEALWSCPTKKYFRVLLYL